MTSTRASGTAADLCAGGASAVGRSRADAAAAGARPRARARRVRARTAATRSPTWPACASGTSRSIDRRCRPHRRHRRRAAPGQPVPGEGGRRRVRRQRVRQAGRLDAGRRARHDRDADRADQHAQPSAPAWKASCAGRSAQPGNANVRSVNALVGETNDGGLNDIRGLHVRPEHVVQAIARRARRAPCEEGSVGAGTGTQAFGWKGGIGTSSRRLPARLRRLHGGRARADQLRRRADDGRRAGGQGTGPLQPTRPTARARGCAATAPA